VAGDADVANQDAPCEQCLEDRVRVVDAAEEHEVRATARGREPEFGEGDRDAFTLAADLVDHCEHLIGVRERAERCSLRQCRQVVGQSHEAQCVDRRRVAGEVTHPRSRERERLAHGA